MLVIVFMDVYEVPNNLSEVHVFEDDKEGLLYSIANLKRRHLVKRIESGRWHPDRMYVEKAESRRPAAATVKGG